MNETRTVQGIVVDREGRPVAQATIAVIDGTAPVPEIALVADDDGRFGLRLPHGSFTLEAQGGGGATGRNSIQVSASSQEIRIEVK